MRPLDPIQEEQAIRELDRALSTPQGDGEILLMAHGATVDVLEAIRELPANSQNLEAAINHLEHAQTSLEAELESRGISLATEAEEDICTSL